MDDLATIAGFLLLRRKVLRTRKNNIFLLSPDLLVRYLCIQCNTEIWELHEPLSRETSFVADCCLAAVGLMRYKSLRRFDSNIPKTLIYAKCTEGAEEAAPNSFLPGKMDIGETLAKISNEYMIRFYTSLSEEFGAKFNLASCYEALSLYLRRKYENVLTVCTKILQEPEADSELDEFQFLSVNVCYCFNAYFDEDIQALVGFQLLVLQLTSMQHNEEIPSDDSQQSIRLPFADRHSQANSAYKNYNKAFSPILRKQFLGTYLVLRCLLNLEAPMFMVKAAFKCLSLRCRFLFERTLVHFVHQKLIRYRRATASEPMQISFNYLDLTLRSEQ